jgi:oligoribonuclease NrnB/cAMP/cGMP phosphodiesterase (DHH superfamily)
MSKYLVLHHSDQDGFGAAHAFKTANKDVRDYDNAQYVMMNYGDAPPLDLIDKDTHVFIFDFSFQIPVMKEIYEKAASVILIDHHKTVQCNPEYQKYTTDMYVRMDLSAAVLVWEYFSGAGLPRLYAYISDFDLYKFELPESKAINAAINSYPLRFDVYDDLLQVTERCRDSLEEQGIAILRFSDRVIDVALAQSRITEYEGMKVLVANVLYPFISDFGMGALVKNPEIDMTATFFVAADGRKRWSLRSKRVDVSKIAERFGGGGHAPSAGFIGEFL